MVVHLAGPGLVGRYRRVLAVEPGIYGTGKRGPALFHAHVHFLVVQAGRPAVAGANALGQGVVGVGRRAQRILTPVGRRKDFFRCGHINHFEPVVDVHHAAYPGGHVAGLFLLEMRADPAREQGLAAVHLHVHRAGAHIGVAGQGRRNVLANVRVGHHLLGAHLEQVVHLAHAHHVARIPLGGLLGAQGAHRAGQRHHAVVHLHQGFGGPHPRVEAQRVAHGVGNGLVCLGRKFLAAQGPAQGPIGHEQVAGVHAGGPGLVSNGHQAVLFGRRAHCAREVHHAVGGAHFHQRAVHADVPVEQLPHLIGNFFVRVEQGAPADGQVVGDEGAHPAHALQHAQHQLFFGPRLHQPGQGHYAPGHGAVHRVVAGGEVVGQGPGHVALQFGVAHVVGAHGHRAGHAAHAAHGQGNVLGPLARQQVVGKAGQRDQTFAGADRNQVRTHAFSRGQQRLDGGRDGRVGQLVSQRRRY